MFFLLKKVIKLIEHILEYTLFSIYAHLITYNLKDLLTKDIVKKLLNNTHKKLVP